MKLILHIFAIFFFSSHSDAKSAQEALCKISGSLKNNLEIIAQNVTNHRTTRTPEGGPYVPKELNCINGKCKVTKVKIVPIKAYEPKHPDADKEGYVSYPNINLDTERIKFQLIAERIFALAERKECKMSKGLSSKTFMTIYYDKNKSSLHSFVKNEKGEIIIWETLNAQGISYALNLLTGRNVKRK